MNQYDAYRDFVEAFQRDSTELVKLTPEQLAKQFWSMTSGKQAEFFNALAAEIAITRLESPGCDAMQWAWLVNDLDKLENRAGWDVLDDMAETLKYKENNV